MEEMKLPEPIPVKPSSEFSGVAMPEIKVVPFADNGPNASGDFFSATELPKAPLVKLSPRENKKLFDLLNEEKAAAEAMKKATRRRDLFCLDLEKKYSLCGLTWSVDIGKGLIEVTGTRSKPKPSE